MDFKSKDRALDELENDVEEAGNGDHLAEDWNWNWKENGEEKNEEQEYDEDGDTHAQNLPTPSDVYWEISDSESSDGDDKYFEPIDMPLTSIRRHDWQHWEQRAQDWRSGICRTEIMLFEPKNEVSNEIYDPRPIVAPAPQEGKRMRLWMLGKTSEPQSYSPKPIAKSPFELFCPVILDADMRPIMQPAVFYLMPYLTQHDVDMVRATSKTLRTSWPLKIMGRTAYCEMVLPAQNFNKTISRTRESEGARAVCGYSDHEHAVIPCQGNELGVATHGLGHEICERCHISTLWDMRQAQRYVFGRHKRLRICQYCRIKVGPDTEIPQFCRCEDSLANRRLYWDCSRNNKNEQGSYLPNGISIRGSKFPHCDRTGECSWCLHFPHLEKYGQCNQALCIHCPTENNYEKQGENDNGEDGEEEMETVPSTNSKTKPDLEDDQLLFNSLHDDFHCYEACEEAESIDCPVCGIDIDGLRLQNEEGPQNPEFKEKYAFLCHACGGVCGSNQLKGDFSVSETKCV